MIPLRRGVRRETDRSLGRVTYGLTALLNRLGVEGDWAALVDQIDAEKTEGK